MEVLEGNEEEKKKGKTPPKVFSVQVVDDKEEGVTIMASKSDNMSDLEMLGHLEYVKSNIINTMIAKTKQIQKEKEGKAVIKTDLDGVKIPKFEKTSTTL